MTEPAPLPRVFRDVAMTVVPESAELGEDGWNELESLVVESLRQRPAAVRRKLRLFMKLVQWLPVLRYGRSFTALSHQRRTRFLARLQEHRLAALRLGFWGLRTLCFLGYYGRAGGARSVGYRPDAAGWDAWR